ncbi:MAG: hypothetical protein KJ792_08185 [Actinobacteria bacterium]|nr:hypothetical protein [Actinomycetota bacterium]
MRLYLPATLDEVVRPDDVLTPRSAHAVTPALRAALPDEDDEGLEFVAQLAAADDSLALLADQPDAPRLRLVVALDVAESLTAPTSAVLGPPTLVQLLGPVSLGDADSLLVDEPDALDDVVDALAGDAQAGDRLEERDLLWYDVSEIGRIPRV